MYIISNKQRDELCKLLHELRHLAGSDNRTLNNKRKAVILIKQLDNSIQITKDQIIKS